MPAYNDAERVGIEIFGRFGTGIVAVIYAWSFAVLDIITGLSSQMTRRQFDLAVSVFERWGMAVPDSLHSGPPKEWTRSEIPELKKFFEGTLTVVADIKLAYDAMPHARTTRDRDMLLLQDAEAFCTGELAEIDHISAMGDIYCEAFVFMNLIYHCKDMMRVVMGDAVVAQFIAEYEDAMKSLRRAYNLVNAPEV